ncbi:MAG: cyclophane-forming radical SAM/SPASM peptide maturase GrrM/OscB [Xenococcaceae cyanobacterium]
MVEKQLSSCELVTFGPIDLVIIQATSFCNLDCDYCYLPDRQLKNRFSLDLIEPIFKNIFTSPFLREDFTVCWHAGEPLAVPISFYDSALSKINELDRDFNVNNFLVRQSIQTNATLINQDWCDLFKKYQINIGVSLDGPAFIHDAHRKTRTGLGTHASTMRGIAHLQKNHIDFNVIAVITQESLDYPDEIFNFFMENGITDVGFNLEEIEGVNKLSSLKKSGTEARYRAFMKRFWELITQAKGAFMLREFERICSLMYAGERIKRSGLVTPFVMINIDSQGNFSTFDPELLGVKTDIYGDFILGNVLHDTFESVCQTEKFQKIYQDINAGVELCRNTCQYFGVCGGGSGSNKYWENGTFRSAETMACKYYEKVVTDIVLEELETALGLNHDLKSV